MVDGSVLRKPLPSLFRWSPSRSGSPPAIAVCVALGCWLVGGLYLWAGARLYEGIGTFGRPLRAVPFLDMWARWDARWYERIATQGYEFLGDEQSSVAFFPLYPLLMRGVHAVTGLPALVAGMAITLVLGLVAVALFHRWAPRVVPEHTANLATVLLTFWPFAFYLYGAVYSDALFLVLVVGAFLALERKRVALSTLLGALATATRPLAPAVVLGLWVRQLERQLRAGERLRARDFLPLLSGSGLGAYMLYQWVRFGTPTAFVQAQAGWSQSPGLANYLKLPFFTEPMLRAYWNYALPNALLALLFLGLCVPMRRRLGWGYTVYASLAMGIPFVVSHMFIGLGRYALGAFPCFVMLAVVLEERPRARAMWCAASAVGLVVLVARFAVGRFVA